MADINFTSYAIAASGAGTKPITVPDRLAQIVNVKDYGATGNGSIDDTSALQSAIDAAFGPASSPHGHFPGDYLNKVLFFPPGHYITSASLVLTTLVGARIVGSGQHATLIENTTAASGTGANANVFTTNGIAYSRIENLSLKTTTQPTHNYGGHCFRLDKTTSPLAPQSNSFYNCSFIGGQYGLPGMSGIMSSETLIMNCSFINQSNTEAVNPAYGGAGVITGAFNTCDETIIGGRFVNCFNGILVGVGSIPIIQGVSFEGGGNWDIRVEGGANDCYYVGGCRSTSPNFIRCAHGSWVVDGCVHNSPTNGTFIQNFGCAVVAKSCTSTKGQFYHIYGSRSKLQECVFGRNDWLNFQTPNAWWYGILEVENLTVGPTLTLLRRQRIHTRDGVNMLTQNYVVS